MRHCTFVSRRWGASTGGRASPRAVSNHASLHWPFGLCRSRLRRPPRRCALTPVLLAGFLAWAGCSSIGPRTVARDRFDYSASVADSWKRQTLLNIVKLRYMDPPIYIDVGQIVAGYSLEADLSVGSSFVKGGENSLNLGAGGHYTDRPTVTYTPLTGAKFVRSALMPLPPEEVFFTVQAGWPANGVLYAAVASINGLKNQETNMDGVTPPDPEFLRVLELLRKIQISGAVALRIQMDPQKQQTTILTFRSKGISAETLAEIAEVRRLLGLDPEAQEFRLVFAATPSNDRELAVLTRSLVQIMATLSTHVEGPPEDIAQGRATPGVPASAPLHIGCARAEPADAFVAVAYRHHWFWIDDRDLKTKRAFGLIMMLFSLAESGEEQPLPLITIPAQ
jgi:hypothetical protein